MHTHTHAHTRTHMHIHAHTHIFTRTNAHTHSYVAPYDYDTQTKSLGKFSDDERELSFNVSIMDDNISEGDEIFYVSLTLASQSSRVTVSPAEAAITIKDDGKQL